MTRFTGFAPVFDERSRVLILGSFPSVKSREEGFYYANPHNRFWKIVSSFFGEEIPSGTEKRREFLLRNRIALWDMVSSCEVDGSRDESIRGEELARVSDLLSRLNGARVLCNGHTAYRLFCRECPEKKALLLPSTSPRNAARKDTEEVWHRALAEVFGTDVHMRTCGDGQGRSVPPLPQND